MKTFHLRAARHAEPTCPSFEDEELVRSYERAVRIHRAHVEAYTIASIDGRVDGGYRVQGDRGAAYLVDIVDASGEHDACTCPDFLSNELGTCKHLEAVRRAVRSSAASKALQAKLARAPAQPTIAVDVRGTARLLALGRWTRRAKEALGLAPDEEVGARIAPRVPLQGGLLDGGVRVVHAAPLVRARLESGKVAARRRREVEDAFARGKLGTEVLAQPLFPYQQAGALHLVGAGRALLADDMGLGKTVQAIAAAEILRARGEAAQVLIVTVASLKHQWAREIERFTGQRAVVVSGGPRARRQALETDAPYKILNYEQTWRELSLIEALGPDVLILDEAQRAKNFRTKTASTLRAIPSRFAFVLTGTPVENRLDDLYSLMQLIDPAIFGPLWRFNLDFHSQTDRGKIVGYKNLAALRQRIAGVVLRRRKEEVLTQLPPLTEQTRYAPLTREQRAIERGYRADAAVLLKIAERRSLTKEEQDRLMMLLLKARQACNALELCDPERSASPKLDEFEDLMTEIAAQGASKVVVFSEWVEMLKLASARLEQLEIGHLMLHGGVPSEHRPALLDRFREAPEVRVLLSTDAGGVGLNLQAATYVVHLDLPWNPGKLDQRTARAHRLGQTRGVSVIYLVAEDGIERGIEGTLAGKRAVRSAALDASSAVESLEAPSFSVFLRQLRETMSFMDEEEWEETGAEPPEERAASSGIVTPADRGGDAVPSDGPGAALLAIPPTTHRPDDHQAQETHAHTHAHAPAHAGSSAGPSAGSPARGGEAPEPGAPPVSGRLGPKGGYETARRRLELARLVLSAGFTQDAVRAAYEGLAAAIASLLEGPPPGTHPALVAAIYRDLLPSGRISPAAHVALARIHDLTQLELAGVEVDAAIADTAVREAEEWLGRMAAPRAAGATTPADGPDVRVPQAVPGSPLPPS